jgi:hypothetical protein
VAAAVAATAAGNGGADELAATPLPFFEEAILGAIEENWVLWLIR